LVRLARICRSKGHVGRAPGLVARTLVPLVLAASGASGSGCAGTTRLGDRQVPPGASSTTATSSTGSSSRERAEYLRALRREQAGLAVAERAIAREARTPAQLSRSIRLLASAIRRLGDGLASIKPPAEVASQHARLESIVHAYEVALQRAARAAVRPRGRLHASNMLVSATTVASSEFASTVSAIDAALGG
jgi:hypothetical protein